MCWRLKDDSGELTIDEWKSALESLRDLVGRFSIQFSGGEVFLKEGFLDLLEFCRDRRIDWGLITNGSCFRGDVVRRVVAARPLNIDISVDGPTPEVHDGSRGIPGSLRAIERGIAALHEEEARQSCRVLVRIKSTVHAENFEFMPAMTSWVRRVGALCVNFLPVHHWSPEVKTRLWIGPERRERLEAVVSELLAQRRRGEPIETSEQALAAIPEHFLGRATEVSPPTCRAGLRNYHILENGDVIFCDVFKPVGNVRTQTAAEIWRGAEAVVRRRETTECGQGCEYSCRRSKPLANWIDRGLLVLRSVRS